MIKILEEAEKKKKARGGKSNAQPMEERLLMALEYLREYRTYFHVASSYEISESSCYRNIKWIEDTLIKHPDFALHRRKEFSKSDMDYEIVLIDATETPITNKGSFIQVKREGIQKLNCQRKGLRKTH